eukprot:311768-Chlamydomonas_euryale.AAC.1
MQRMVRGAWRITHGALRMAQGPCSAWCVAHNAWRMVSGPWVMANGAWRDHAWRTAVANSARSQCMARREWRTSHGRTTRCISRSAWPATRGAWWMSNDAHGVWPMMRMVYGP